MKTNQVLIRKMGDYEILQRTSDGMFNATSLLKQWNLSSGQQKQIGHYLENSATKEFIQALTEEQDSSYRNSVMIKSKANKGKNAGTWMDPLLFLDFAMWLNPAFKVKVLKFVYDELVRYRCDAGDSYREMAGAVKKVFPESLLPSAIQNIAKALNHIVFGSHESDIRNRKGEENLLRELADLEKDITKFIDNGFIRSYDQIIDYLRREWCKKWQPKILSR